MRRRERNDDARGQSFYARISAANAARPLEPRHESSPGEIAGAQPARPAPPQPWNGLRLLGAALLVQVAGWMLLLTAVKQDELIGFLVIAAWCGTAAWMGARTRTWWWPAMWLVAPGALAVTFERWSRDPDPDAGWALLALFGLAVASFLPLAAAAIGVMVGKLAGSSGSGQARRRR